MSDLTKYFLVRPSWSSEVGVCMFYESFASDNMNMNIKVKFCTHADVECDTSNNIYVKETPGVGDIIFVLELYTVITSVNFYSRCVL